MDLDIVLQQHKPITTEENTDKAKIENESDPIE